MELEIFAEEMALFRAGKVDMIKMAARLKTYRELLVMVYIYCINNEGLTRLENLPEELKKEVWEDTKGECAALNKKQRIELSKIVYLVKSKI